MARIDRPNRVGFPRPDGARNVARTNAKGSDASPPEDPAGYTVVARRYRPRRFEDVVGQDHVVQSLRNAIRMGRLAQAYVFSGTRGVGKTSMARIFAKCLNCVQGPTESPCLECDICRAIAVGQDVDVIEIDGASNNGVEAVRELRQNASLRPSRARFKIYYIDEVHMLSTGAFNALLKTLEEPPEHVKFFFATTEANKIPITVLSRCQKYDFAGISPEEIVSTLADICEKEQVEADRDALQSVARRAGGSMRDAQSLLEQLLASGGRRLTADLVHQALGTASDERILGLIDALADRDPAGTLRQVEEAVSSGVQPVDLLNGLLEYLRDLLVLAAGADVPLLAAPPGERERLRAVTGRWSLDSILAGQQILAEARGRLRGSPHGRLLIELALLRVARLEDLAELGELVTRLASMETPAVGPKPPASEKKKPEPAEPLNGSHPPTPSRAATVPEPTAQLDEIAAAPIALDTVLHAWPAILAKLGMRVAVPLTQVRPTAISGPDVVVIALSPSYNYVAGQCDTPEARRMIEEALLTVLGRRATLRFVQTAELAGISASPASASAPDSDGLADDPLIQKVVELFEARRIRVDTEGKSGE